MIVLSDGERKQIEEMPPGYRRYCVYPEGWKSDQEVLDWMDELPSEVIEAYDLAEGSEG